jgi:hypothetical protein
MEYFNFLAWAFRKKSKSFLFRFYRSFFCPDLKPKIGFVGLLRNCFRRVLLLLKGLKYIVGGTYPLFYLTKFLYEKNLPINQSLKENILSINPDLIIYASSAYDAVGNDICRIADDKFTTLFVIDNWDNLTSKSIMWTKPNYLGVWGNEALLQAIDIQGFKNDQIFILGSARFDVYYKGIDKTNRIYEFPYIVFAGCSLPFDELSTLKKLDKILEKFNQTYSCNVRIVYRPHPWRQTRKCPDFFDCGDFKFIILDQQIMEAYYQIRSIANVQPPDLDYYPNLLKNSLFTICPLSTMILESLICKKKVLTIAYDDGIHFTSPNRVYRGYLHFEGIEHLPGVQICDNIADLESIFVKIISEHEDLDSDDMRKISELVLWDEMSYNQRLKRVLDNILCKNVS